MFKFLNKNKKRDSDDEIFIKTAALLIHAAKIDQNYQLNEKNIIKKTIISLGVPMENLDNLMAKAENMKAMKTKSWNLLEKLKKLVKILKLK